MGRGLPHGRARPEVDQAVKEAAEIEGFIRAQTTIMALPLSPQIELHLAADARGIFQATETFCGGNGWPSYWAFAWPGGQALASYISNNPHLVAGKRVLDLGSGSGVGAIAAGKAGASRVIAADPDPLAGVAIAINAARNEVDVQVVTQDVLGAAPDADLVLIGDLVYEPELATRVTRLLETTYAKGIDVIWSDRTTARRPALPFVLLSEYRAPLLPALEESHFESARVWRLGGTERQA